MNEDMQQQFVSWLAQKLQAKDEQDLKSKMQQMGHDGIKQAYDAFMQESQQGQQGQGMPVQAQGGKLEYLRCLQAYKKGGAMAMKDCGCGTSKMKSGGRMDQETADKNPGKKDWMSLGKNKDDKSAKREVPKGKTKWVSAVTKVPGSPKKVNSHQHGGPMLASNTPRIVNSAAPNPVPPAALSQHDDWNRFIGWMKDKGYSSDPAMNTDKRLGAQRLNEYRQQFADSKLSYDQVPGIQQSILNERNGSLQDVAAGRAKLTGTGFMEGSSNLDGWLGTKTASMPYPRVVKSGPAFDPAAGTQHSQILMSDKANGTDNTYNPRRGQAQLPSPPTIQPSANYWR